MNGASNSAESGNSSTVQDSQTPSPDCGNSKAGLRIHLPSTVCENSCADQKNQTSVSVCGRDHLPGNPCAVNQLAVHLNPKSIQTPECEIPSVCSKVRPSKMTQFMEFMQFWKIQPCKIALLWSRVQNILGIIGGLFAIYRIFEELTHEEEDVQIIGVVRRL